MAKQILNVLLIVTLLLPTIILSAPNYDAGEHHRLVRSPHHDGTDHDHDHNHDHDHEHVHERTDQDHKHPVLTTSSADNTKKISTSDESVKQRPVRETKDDHQKSEAKIPKTKPIDVSFVEKEKINLDSNPPGPFLLQGVPIQTAVTVEKQDETEKSKTKRETPTNSGRHNPLPPEVLPHLDPTPPPGYKPKYRRDTSSPGGAEKEPVTPGAPIRPPNGRIHTKTEDGRDAVIALPPIPLGPLSPTH